MQRALSLLVVVLLAAWLAAPGVGALLGAKGADPKLENRALNKRPAFTAAAVLDGSYGEGFAAWFWDAMPLRPALLRLDHAVDFHVFGDSPVPQAVVFGERGIAFRTERIEGRRAGGVDPERLRGTLQRVRAAFDDAGVRFLLVVSPHKTTLYADALPVPLRRAFDASVPPTLAMLHALRAEGYPLLDLWTPMREEERRLSEEPTVAHPQLRMLFRPTDEHWSVEAGRLQARAIVEALAPGSFDEQRAPRLSERYGLVESELSGIFLKLGLLAPYRTLEGNVPTPTEEPVIGQRRSMRFRHDPSDQTAERVFILRDSFLAGAAAHPAPAADGGAPTVAAFIPDVEFIHWNALAEDTAPVTARFAHADTVVVQVAQLNLGNLIVHEQRLVALAKAAAKQKRLELHRAR